MTERAYGIDLGTTRSCIAYIDDHRESRVVPNAEGRPTTPSVVYFPREDEPVVGMAAKRAARKHPELVVEAIKREMGLEWAREFHRRRYSPEDVSAAILRQLVADAERETGDRPSKAVITVPASFTARQKDATRDAARRAGLNEVELLPEPLAAALTYRGGDDGILVYDLGGGTFDATLVDIEEPTFTALGTVGDQNLGGREWDWDIARLFARRFSENTGVPPDALTRDPVTRGHLLDRAEAAKIGLARASLEGEGHTTQEIRHGDRVISLELTLEQFDDATRHRVVPTIERLDDLLSTTGYGLEQLTRILLVGGSTLMPQVQAALRDRFPRVARDIVDPHMAVAKGAALRAHYGERMEIRAAGIERSDELGELESSDGERNWFGLLGLDPSEDGAERIEAAINAGRLEWSRQTSDLDPDRAHRARHRLALIPAMRRELLSDAERRRERAGAARRAKDIPGGAQSGDRPTGEEFKTERVRRQIGLMKKLGHSWDPRHVAKLAKEHSIDRMQVEQLLREQGIVLDRVDLTPGEASDIATLLAEDGRGATDLYHFLSEEAGSAVGPDAGAGDLRERARQIFLRRQNTHPVRGSLASLAMKHFENDGEKRRYDRTLAREVTNGPKLQTELDAVFFDGNATREQFESLLTAASEHRVTREMAREAILARAEEEGWTVAEADSGGRRPRAGSRELRDDGAIASRVSGDRDALMALHRSTGGGRWRKSVNWGTDAPLRDWWGVRVDDAGRVTELRLDNNNLRGTIPLALGDLADLKRLDLEGNNLTGPVLPQLGGLADLKHLNLGSNNLTGTIPLELSGLADLKRLNLGGNNLKGPIPSELASLANLEELYLFKNHLTGTIPLELSGLAGLKRLNLGGNNLKGSIPSELAGLADLEELALYDNNLTDIPPELGRLAKLEKLCLRGNGLTGPIPPELGSLANLTYLGLQDNGLTGPIPRELGGLANLRGLWLHDNRLTGPIPPELGRLGHLEKLCLRRNRLTGRIPPELGGLANLRGLCLRRNHLTGPIPGKLGGLANLKELWLHDNKLTGPIPPELGRLGNLEKLCLRRNRLTGRIPRELGDLANLKRLNLGGNNLKGSIPSELAGLANLTELYLFNNRLTGSIPPELGGLANLERLDLRENNLWGTIPPQLTSQQNLAVDIDDQNKDWSDRDALMALYQSTSSWAKHKNWGTDAPLRDWWGVRVDDGGRVTELHLAGNAISGTIPPELGSLGNLKRLDLSYNELKGTIPPELGVLGNLEWLNLRDNNLTGPVPTELGALANLKYLRLKSNELTGPIPPEMGRSVETGCLLGIGLFLLGVIRLPGVFSSANDNNTWTFVHALVVYVLLATGFMFGTKPRKHKELTEWRESTVKGLLRFFYVVLFFAVIGTCAMLVGG